jgi:hypothetical protein
MVAWGWRVRTALLCCSMPISPERQNPFWPTPPKPRRKTALRWVIPALVCIGIAGLVSSFLS